MTRIKPIYHYRNGMGLTILVMKCPTCDSEITFIESTRNKELNNGIRVNCETSNLIRIPEMYLLSSGCKNPFCNWSKVKDVY